MMESILKTINSVNSANYHLNKFLSASAWSSLSTLIILQKGMLDDLTLNVVAFPSSMKQLPSILNKISYFHLYISISEFVILLSCRASGCLTLHRLGSM